MTFDFSGLKFWLRATPLAMLVASCSQVEATQDAPAKSPVQTQSARHPISGLQVTPVTIVSGEKRLEFKSELAISVAEQAQGLMFRQNLADDEAMANEDSTMATND